MTTPTSHHPRRGRMAVAAATAVVLVVVGLVLFVTAGPNRSGDPAQAVAGAPSLTSTTPYAPSLPPLAGAAVGGSVSTPGHPSPGAVADGPVSPPGSDAGGPGAPPAASGVPAPGAAVPGQPGSSGGQAVPGGVVVPGQPGSSSNAAPGAAAGNTGGPTLVVRRAVPATPVTPHRAAPEVVAPASVLQHGLQLSPVPRPRCLRARSPCPPSVWDQWGPGRAVRSPTAFSSRHPLKAL